MPDEISIYKGMDHTFRATVTTGAATWDISGATNIDITVKQYKSSTSATLSYAGTPLLANKIAWGSDGTDGVIDISFLDSETSALTAGQYVYDIKITDAGGLKHTPIDSILTIKETVS